MMEIRFFRFQIEEFCPSDENKTSFSEMDASTSHSVDYYGSRNVRRFGSEGITEARDTSGSLTFRIPYKVDKGTFGDPFVSLQHRPIPH
jgi:hypothetical protein